MLATQLSFDYCQVFPGQLAQAVLDRPSLLAA
jgi:hypothetical protein